MEHKPVYAELAARLVPSSQSRFMTATKVGSRYKENQRTSRDSIFLMFIPHISFRIIQAANNSLAGAIGVASPGSIFPDRKPETFSSRSAPTLIESRPARSRLTRNSTDAPSK